MKRKDKLTMLERLYLKLDIPPDIINDMVIEVRGRTNVRIHGCREILIYTTDKIKLQLSECVLQILGKDLYCTSYGSGNMEIDGVIFAIELD